MYIVVVTKNGARDFDSLLHEGRIYPDKASAKKAIEEETKMDLQLNQKYYYKIKPVYIALGEDQ